MLSWRCLSGLRPNWVRGAEDWLDVLLASPFLSSYPSEIPSCTWWAVVMPRGHESLPVVCSPRWAGEMQFLLCGSISNTCPFFIQSQWQTQVQFHQSSFWATSEFIEHLTECGWRVVGNVGDPKTPHCIVYTIYSLHGWWLPIAA